MDNVRCLAVHHLGGALDLGTCQQTEDLVPETDAEDGYIVGQTLEEFEAVSRVGGVAGAGREADHFEGGIGGQFQHSGVVVVEYEGVFAEGLEGLDEVVGEGVVVIDEQEHGVLQR